MILLIIWALPISLFIARILLDIFDKKKNDLFGYWVSSWDEHTYITFIENFFLYSSIRTINFFGTTPWEILVGTYSITDDKIEFVYDIHKYAFKLSRTKNTITLDGIARFIKK